MNTHNSPSRHLSNNELFEYLDQMLTKEQLDEIESHLEFCHTCAERLAGHKVLFSKIKGLPDELLGRDLAPAVLTAIKEGDALTPIWWWLLVPQGILALGLIAVSLPNVANNSTAVLLPKIGGDILPSLAANLSFWLQKWNSLIDNTSQLLTFDFHFSLSIPLQSILWLLLFATVTWVIGNSILLRPQINKTGR